MFKRQNINFAVRFIRKVAPRASRRPKCAGDREAGNKAHCRADQRNMQHQADQLDGNEHHQGDDQRDNDFKGSHEIQASFVPVKEVVGGLGRPDSLYFATSVFFSSAMRAPSAFISSPASLACTNIPSARFSSSRT